MDFRIIPVLDLKGGHVVRARAGDRANYRPIDTPLARGSRPEDVLAGLRALAPFRTIYVADLDAIGGSGEHDAAVRDLAAGAPDLEIWLDGGFADAGTALRRGHPGVVPILGSESLMAGEILRDAIGVFGPAGFILSLDYWAGRFMGPAEIERDAAAWPDRVILMTLDRVGMGEGPDYAALSALLARAGRREVFAAGGVRDEADLDRLRSLGLAGVLVASALHDGLLSPAAVAARLCQAPRASKPR
jgi:phosphoribosylformimino-5-aminoimidazole carboxamide ribotide isomerase